MKGLSPARRRMCLLGGLALLAVLPACSRRSLYPVRGAVLVNQKPAEGALVVFHPIDDAEGTAPKPRGNVQADGSFTLSTHEKDDGAAVGEYVVTINWLDVSRGLDE